MKKSKGKIDWRKIGRAVGTEFRENPIIIVCAIVILSNLLFGLLADPAYIRWRMRDLQSAYEEISTMDLEDLSEEDQEILQNFQSQGLEFVITDEKFHQIYMGGIWYDDEKLEKYMSGRADLYQEKPSITVRNFKNLHLLRLRAKIVQEDKTYYVYIRREMRAIYEFTSLTVIYYSMMGMLLLFTVDLILKHRDRKPSGAAGSRKAGGATGSRKAGSAAGSGKTGGAVQTQMDEAQKEFVANISHELKTPLAVISGQVEMLQTMGNEIDRDYYFASIREEIDRMSGLVGNLLDITIMEHNIEKMELTRVDATDLMEYMMLRYDALFKQNCIKVEPHIEKNVKVHANRMYLEQAVNNYIMNAFQHTAQGKRMGVSLTVEQDMAYIGVYNQGPNIPEAEMGHIWESFYANPSGKREKNPPISNAGLGLYMVKKIVDQHGGVCGVENKENGVQFWMRIPIEK